MKASEIAELVGGTLYGNGGIEIDGLAALSDASTGKLVFTESVDRVCISEGCCLLAPVGYPTEGSDCVVTVAVPKAAFCIAASRILSKKASIAGNEGCIHPTTHIAEDAAIAENVRIGAYSCVGRGCTIGDGSVLHNGVRIGSNVSIGSNCVIDSNTTIYDDSIIGSHVLIHSGAVIGADGFGFVRHGNEYLKFPQIGRVVIGDNVEIGANTCIDRGALGETRIGSGTKIDNLVQIAHNVDIGSNVVIAAQTGISGSTVIEDDCVIGGQVGMGDHARILSGAVIGSQAGVLPGKIVRPGVWWGTPVQPLDQYKRQNAMVKGIRHLKEEIKKLKQAIRDLRSDE